MNDSTPILERLMAVIADRKARPAEGSYTCQLLAGGSERIGGKILEEAAELVEAASSETGADKRRIVHEAADLLYHVLVLLGHRDIKLAEVEAELERRFGTSGLAEKAARAAQQTPRQAT